MSDTLGFFPVGEGLLAWPSLSELFRSWCQQKGLPLPAQHRNARHVWRQYLEIPKGADVAMSETCPISFKNLEARIDAYDGPVFAVL